MATIYTKEDLVKALERGDNRIEIEGDLAKQTIKAKAEGNMAAFLAGALVGVAATIIGVILGRKLGGGNGLVANESGPHLANLFDKYSMDVISDTHVILRK